MEDTRDVEEILRDSIEQSDLLGLASIPGEFQSKSEATFTTNCWTGKQITGKMKSQAYSIVETNMEDMYKSVGWGWNEQEKRKELFHPLSRLLCMVDNEGKLAAYAAFRFEWDDEDEPEFPVLYIYEMQVDSKYQLCGLGSFIMSCIFRIAQQTQMTKVMLTCFKVNVQALKFYSKVGFGVDSTSPSVFGFHDEPHEILSNHSSSKPIVIGQ